MSSKVAYSTKKAAMISFRDVIAGILIGALMEPWLVVFTLCIVWAFCVLVIHFSGGEKEGV